MIIKIYVDHATPLLKKIPPKDFHVDTEGKTPVVFDSGCTIAVMSHRDDFIGPITKIKQKPPKL